MANVKLFVKQFVAILKGDDAEATAVKALRQVESALKTQIAALEGDTITKEDALEAAKEHEALALVNGGNLLDAKSGYAKDRTQYVQNLIDAANTTTRAQKDLDDHKKKIEFLKSKLDLLNQEDAVEAATAANKNG